MPHPLAHSHHEVGLRPVPPQAEQLRCPVPLQLAQEDHLACSLMERSLGWPVPSQPLQGTFPDPSHFEHVSSAILTPELDSLLRLTALLVGHFYFG
jgi:hypothetical protein